MCGIFGTSFPINKTVLTSALLKMQHRGQDDLSTFADENVMNFITGVKPMSQWNDFVSKLKAMKVDELAKIYNEAYSRY